MLLSESAFLPPRRLVLASPIAHFYDPPVGIFNRTDSCRSHVVHEAHQARQVYIAMYLQ